MDRQPGGSQGGTYSGNAVACAAAKATIEVMLESGFMGHVQERGQQITEALRAMQQEGVAPIRDVRGPGLMIGLEFDDERVEKGFATKVAKACLSRGMIVLTTGIFETLRLIPPLTISAEDCAHGMAVLRDACKEVAGQA